MDALFEAGKIQNKAKELIANPDNPPAGSLKNTLFGKNKTLPAR
jgi:hypothetical protein